jgi:hypothetical protein
MNIYIRVAATQCSLGTWFFLRNMSVDTLHKGDTDNDDNDDYDNNNNNNNNNNNL